MTIGLTFISRLMIELAPSHEMGVCPAGTRRIIPIAGGIAEGPLLNGRILALGADWQTATADGVAELDARYAIETGEGAIVEVISQGIRTASPDVAHRIASGETVPPSDYYMRTAIRLETGHPGYAWLNRSIFLATGGKAGATVQLSIFRVD